MIRPNAHYTVLPVWAMMILSASMIQDVVPLTDAQNEDSNDPKRELTLSPKATVFYSTFRATPGSDEHERLYQREVSDNIDIPLARIRFLADEGVRKELKLLAESEKKLEPLFRKLEQFDRKDKWNFYSKSEAVSHKTRENVKQFIEELKEVEQKQLVPPEALERLEQIRWQFHCLGNDIDLFRKTPLRAVKSRLNLTAKQLESIREIIKKELGDELRLESQFDEISEVLTEDQQREVDQIFRPFYPLNTPAGLSLAQCQRFLHIEDVERDASRDFALELIDSCILTLSGRHMIESVYKESGDVFSVWPWRMILEGILNGNMDWLELTDDQMAEIELLKQVKPRDGGGTKIKYFGMEAYSGIQQPEANWTSQQVDSYWEQHRKALREADSRMGERLRSILLPVQLDAIHTALAAQKIMELGPYHTLPENLSEALEITSEQKKQIAKLRDRRLKKLQSICAEIDKKARRELSDEQKEFVKQYFGEYCPLYPCIWLFLAPVYFGE